MSNLCAAAVVTPWENVIFCKHPTSAEIYHDKADILGNSVQAKYLKKYFKKKAHQQTHTDQCLPCLAVYTQVFVYNL